MTKIDHSALPHRHPGQVVPVTDAVPEPRTETDERALVYMDLRPGTPGPTPPP